ncbi:MAG: dual specificity protein phosphatase [Myxococcota bacterium]
MKTMVDNLLSRLLSRLGIDLDFELDLKGTLFHRLTPNLYLGSKPPPDQLESLRAAGITHVVSCLVERQRDEMAFLDDAFATLFLPVRDGMYENIADAFAPLFDFAAQAPPGGPHQLLIHCEAGVSRSATLATALVMTRQKLGFYDAFCAIRRERPQVLPNIGFASQLQHLENALFAVPPRPGFASLTRYLCEVCCVPAEAEGVQRALEEHNFDSVAALTALFGGEIPRVVQGARR